MKRILAAITIAAIASFFSITPARSATTMATMPPMAPAMHCPAGQQFLKGYTKANGTKVAGYCKRAPMMETCPKGEMMVKGYTDKKGTMVKSYCRKTPMKKP